MSRPNGTAAWKWVPIATGLVAGTVGAGAVLYSVFQGFYATQQNTVGLANAEARIERLSARIGVIETANAAMRRDLSEVETQFCASDDMRNLTHSTDLRLMAILYEEVFKRPYPIGNAYYPKVCNRTLAR